MNYRKEMRAAVCTAIKADEALADFTVKPAWSQNVDRSEYPIIGVATPRETKDLIAHGVSERTTTLQIAAKIEGGDTLEDALDALSEVIERLVIGAIQTSEIECELRETEMPIDGSAGDREGLLLMTFSVARTLNDPI
ncbi:hypothetical protein [uncultured Tateyamaria sp.]|uniref:hypothetical protein n=1 Tax=uncultured Tateyamaria sp. TaxID=455651 RepID=UPI002616BBD1|nr:hypothetical protein [uncultured Tateyamaria sp.]